MSAGKKGNPDVESRLDDIFGDGEEQAERFDDSGTSAEVGSRLDDIFGGGDSRSAAPVKKAAPPKAAVSNPAPPKKPETKPKSIKSLMINDLKSVVLSLEWEISDQVMQKLGEEIAKLEESCKNDKIVIAFLQLLGSLGKYIQKKRADAHPESITLLHSVYESLESAMLSDELSDVAKKKMLVAQVNKYKQLKEQISLIKPSEKEEKYVPISKPIPILRMPEAKPAPPQLMEEPSIITPLSPTSYMLTEEADMEIGMPRKTDDEVFTEGTQEIIRAVRELQQTIREEFGALRAELKLWREKR